MSDNEQQWWRTARQTRRVANAGWWLHGLGGPLVVLALVIGCATLWTRRLWPLEVAEKGPWFTAGAVVACGLAVGWLMRRRFITTRQALVAMEVRQGLHNALSAAADGHRAWPAPPAYAPKSFRWHLPNLLVPPLVAAALIAAGWWLPVPPPAVATSPEEPTAWREIEGDLRRLEERQAVDPKSAEESRAAIQQLRGAGPGQWFNHASLEATDQLKTQHQQALKALAKNLRQAGQSAGALAADAKPLAPAARLNRKEQFQQAIAGMKAAGLKPNAALWEKLQQLDPAQLGQLDPAELREMLDQMGDCAAALREASGLGDEDALAMEEALGNGGVDRGPGSSDQLFGPDETELQAAQPQALQPRDRTRSAPGDLLNLEQRQHDVEEVSPGLQQAGTAQTEGGGGGAWQDSLRPVEQEALKRFFVPDPPEK